MIRIILNTTLIFTMLLNISCDEDDAKDLEKSISDSDTEIQYFNAEKTTKSHLAKVQYYRWYQLYERPMNDLRIANQMDMFIDDVVIKSALGTMQGKQNYPDRVSVYEGWKNAHHVQNVEVITSDAGDTQIKADIRYQNIQPDGKKASYTIDYVMNLESNVNTLPKISEVSIEATGETEDAFEDSYPNNRINSLMYYWLANMEQLDGNVAPFEELLADDFELNFSTSSQMTTLSQLETWLNGTPKQLKQSSHHPKDLVIKSIGENTFEVSVKFEWYGIAKNEQKLKAVTQHVWIVINDADERFARIKKVDVTQVEPTTIVE